MSHDFRITPRAYDDLKAIARYTRRQWGEEQRWRYLRALDARFAWLAAHPHSGKARPDTCEGYYCFPQGRHLIFYLIREGGIDIIGVPHQQMDVLHYFGSE
ncbi:type II toxin-antitoxin system RelE/ParE family toxin [Algiphilus sp. W345]|uniref:Toxin n=1 Tax=Banduia mediterranea TaxID=3075609 RepID=A0ABU2WMW5_9GAMM|nr:type II toxin-antitoxin system RelE/ParE family toxin [Algiphilus sp. W345]MDT0499187.1 type II toxin-antitoxin system RelE/ParE family toxin [Algiphilus sp. W345]